MGKPGMLQFMGSQRVGHNLVTIQQHPRVVGGRNKLLRFRERGMDTLVNSRTGRSETRGQS